MTDRTLWLVAALWGPCSVLAQPHASPEAQQHFEAATRAFDTGDYDTAVREFQSAYDLTHHPDVLFNIYSAAERAGELQRAEEALDRYLREAQVEATRRPALEERLAHLRGRLATAAQTPTPEPPLPDPHPQISPPPPPPRVAPPIGPDTGPSWIAIGTLIGAGVLVASFGVFAGLSAAENGSVSARCGAAAGRFCTNDDLGTLSLYNTIADISWIAGAAAAALGLVLLFVLPHERGPAIAPAAWIAPGAAGLVLGGRL